MEEHREKKDRRADEARKSMETNHCHFIVHMDECSYELCVYTPYVLSQTYDEEEGGNVRPVQNENCRMQMHKQTKQKQNIYLWKSAPFQILVLAGFDLTITYTYNESK